MLRDLMVRDAAPPITVAARHSRPKDGVAPLAYDRAIQ
jgi:hypothetical protein